MIINGDATMTSSHNDSKNSNQQIAQAIRTLGQELKDEIQNKTKDKHNLKQIAEKSFLSKFKDGAGARSDIASTLLQTLDVKTLNYLAELDVNNTSVIDLTRYMVVVRTIEQALAKANADYQKKAKSGSSLEKALESITKILHKTNTILEPLLIEHPSKELQATRAVDPDEIKRKLMRMREVAPPNDSKVPGVTWDGETHFIIQQYMKENNKVIQKDNGLKEIIQDEIDLHGDRDQDKITLASAQALKNAIVLCNSSLKNQIKSGAELEKHLTENLYSQACKIFLEYTGQKYDKSKDYIEIMKKDLHANGRHGLNKIYLRVIVDVLKKTENTMSELERNRNENTAESKATAAATATATSAAVAIPDQKTKPPVPPRPPRPPGMKQ
jgi:hypothetical protein